jgi:periplasmic protein TonB
MNRASEMSTALQGTETEPTRSTHVSIALIGPDAVRRGVVGKALTSSGDRTVREFSGYPASMNDLQRLLAERCDVVMIDLDSDEKFALEIVSTITSMSDTTVIVYSTRNDPDLLMTAMQAGARDLLPIPEKEVEDAGRGSRPVTPVVSPAVAVPPPAAAVPQRVPHPRMDEVAAQPWSAVPTVEPVPEPATPQRAAQPRMDEVAAQPWSAVPAVAPVPEPATPKRVPQPRMDRPAEEQQSAAPPPPLPHKGVGQPNRVAPDFNEWDRANLRPAQAARVEPAGPESRLRRATDQPAKSKPNSVAAPSAPIAAPRPLREAESNAERPDRVRKSAAEAKEQARKQGGNSKKWLLLAAGPVVVVGLLYFVLMRPIQQSVSLTGQGQSITAEPESPIAAQQPAGAITKPLRSVSPGHVAGAGAGVPAPPAPASSEMMDAQLTAPSRISQEMRKAPAPAEAPPVGPSLGALGGTGLPSAVLGGGQQVKVEPAVSAISAGVAEGMLIHRVNPIYPQFARDNHIGGTVVLKAKITKTGTIEDLQIIGGPKILGAATVDAVRRWRYKPYLLDGQPVEVETTIKVDFLPAK